MCLDKKVPLSLSISLSIRVQRIYYYLQEEPDISIIIYVMLNAVLTVFIDFSSNIYICKC